MSKENKDKEINYGMVCEPAAGSALREVPVSEAALEIDNDFQGRDFGYARTLDEMNLALDEADAERTDPTKWITPAEFHTRLENKYPWLR